MLSLDNWDFYNYPPAVRITYVRLPTIIAHILCRLVDFICDTDQSEKIISIQLF